MAACFPFPLTADNPGTNQTRTLVSSTLPLDVKWQVNTDSPIRFRPYALDGMVLVKTTESGCARCRDSKARLMAFDALIGNKLWESPFSGLFNDIAPILVDDLVIFPISADTALRAVNKRTGVAIWETQTQEQIDNVHGLASDSGLIFVASGIEPVRVYALNPHTGAIVWENSKEFPARSLETLYVANDKLYILFVTAIFVLDPKTGETLQRYTRNMPSYGPPSFHEGIAYITREGGIESIDLVSAMTNWSFEPDCIQDSNQNEGPVRKGRFFLYTPSLTNDSAYVTGGCRKIFALDMAGNEQWSYSGDNIGTISKLIALDGYGFVMFRDGSIRALDLATGKEKGRAETSPKPVTSFADGQGLDASNKMIFATFGDRTLFAFSK